MERENFRFQIYDLGFAKEDIGGRWQCKKGRRWLVETNRGEEVVVEKRQ